MTPIIWLIIALIFAIVIGGIVIYLAQYIVNHLPIDSGLKNIILALVGLALLLAFVLFVSQHFGVLNP